MTCLVIQQDTRWSERASPQRQITKKKQIVSSFHYFVLTAAAKRDSTKKKQKPKKKINFILFFLVCTRSVCLTLLTGMVDIVFSCSVQ